MNSLAIYLQLLMNSCTSLATRAKKEKSLLTAFESDCCCGFGFFFACTYHDIPALSITAYYILSLHDGVPPYV